ncbi:hypothetical protein GOP47_0020154 [Adiantum capillus-veneris]|uniref:Uncharacterized protein n=1 Tax=Adiantum capillus-veneris TaxID=13818 RepID=A0A9D4UDT6_ADICA|nr:hypothetical protein GOP47_0020154 [Adiantum capillus-veneris]
MGEQVTGNGSCMGKGKGGMQSTGGKKVEAQPVREREQGEAVNKSRPSAADWGRHIRIGGDTAGPSRALQEGHLEVSSAGRDFKRMQKCHVAPRYQGPGLVMKEAKRVTVGEAANCM